MRIRIGLAAVLVIAAACSSGGSDQAGPGADTPLAPRTDCLGESPDSDCFAPIPQQDEAGQPDGADASDVPAPSEVDGADVPAPSEVEGSDGCRPGTCVEEVVDLAPNLVAGVSGTVVDQDGKPIAGLFVQPCTYTETTESCLKAISKEDGTWSVNVDPPREIVGLHVRFVTNDYSAMACYYEFAELWLVKNIVQFDTPYKLYSMSETVMELDVPPTGPVTVKASGLSFTVLPEEWFPGVFEPTFVKVRKLPVEFSGCFAGPGEEPDALYAISPDWLGFDTVGGVPVTFDNEPGLAAGAKVTLYFLGALDATVRPVGGDPVLLKTGQWYPLGQATVSGDGKSIVSDDGAGLPWLGIIGYRK